MVNTSSTLAVVRIVVVANGNCAICGARHNGAIDILIARPILHTHGNDAVMEGKTVKTLTREAAHTLVDAAAQMGGLSHLVVAWEPAGFWNANAVWTAQQLHEYVDECAEMLCDRTEACRDDSDTGLPDVDFDAVEG